MVVATGHPEMRKETKEAKRRKNKILEKCRKKTVGHVRKPTAVVR
jgi:hypothetical protein